MHSSVEDNKEMVVSSDALSSKEGEDFLSGREQNKRATTEAEQGYRAQATNVR